MPLLSALVRSLFYPSPAKGQGRDAKAHIKMPLSRFSSSSRERTDLRNDKKQMYEKGR